MNKWTANEGNECWILLTLYLENNIYPRFLSRIYTPPVGMGTPS